MIVMSITFITIWILSVQILKGSLSHDDEVAKLSTFQSRVRVIDYKVYRKYGVMIGNLNGNEFEFIDDNLKFRHEIEPKIGDFITIIFLQRIEGLILFETVFHITDVIIHKQYHKW